MHRCRVHRRGGEKSRTGTLSGSNQNAQQDAAAPRPAVSATPGAARKPQRRRAEQQRQRHDFPAAHVHPQQQRATSGESIIPAVSVTAQGQHLPAPPPAAAPAAASAACVPQVVARNSRPAPAARPAAPPPMMPGAIRASSRGCGPTLLNGNRVMTIRKNHSGLQRMSAPWRNATRSSRQKTRHHSPVPPPVSARRRTVSGGPGSAGGW